MDPPAPAPAARSASPSTSASSAQDQESDDEAWEAFSQLRIERPTVEVFSEKGGEPVEVMVSLEGACAVADSLRDTS